MKKVLTVVAMLGSYFAVGQSKPSTVVWTQEPTSFFGVKFGLPLAESLHECAKTAPNGVNLYSYVPNATPCWMDLGGDPRYFLDHLPNFFNIVVLNLDNHVAAIRASTDSRKNDDVLAALIQRFGQPQLSNAEDVRSKGGVPYKNHLYDWRGQNVSIHFETVGPKVDEGLLSVTTKSYEDHQAELEKKKAKGLADSF